MNPINDSISARYLNRRTFDSPLILRNMPFLVNRETGEPYIQLPSPHSNIIITPPSLDDAKANTVLLNEPSVYPMLVSPPYPFFEEHAVSYLKEITKSSKIAWDEIKEDVLAGHPDFIAASTPVSSIREVMDDGTSEYIGNISFERSRYAEEADESERARLHEENTRKQKGDPSILWTFGG